MLNLPGMHGNHPLMARFNSDGNAVGTAVALAIRFGHETGLALDAHAKLAVVVEELVANIVDHGAAEGTPIEMALSLEPGFVRFILRDCGIHYDPRTAIQSASPPDWGGGAGLALVRAWARIVSYTEASGGNQLVLLMPRNS